ncbi:uncharacterized protein V1510DRAFT_431859 [Dipodascopsis tothii]|uniref:uncharacterized protein n=1 Tax=Dipodascopsis tothii TaxID=44089 RepID=UPI0034CEB34F
MTLSQIKGLFHLRQAAALGRRDTSSRSSARSGDRSGAGNRSGASRDEKDHSFTRALSREQRELFDFYVDRYHIFGSPDATVYCPEFVRYHDMPKAARSASAASATSASSAWSGKSFTSTARSSTRSEKLVQRRENTTYVPLAAGCEDDAGAASDCEFCRRWNELEWIQNQALAQMHRTGGGEVESLLAVVGQIRRRVDLEAERLQAEMWAEHHLEGSFSSALIRDAVEWYRKQRTSVSSGLAAVPLGGDSLERRLGRRWMADRMGRLLENQGVCVRV